MTSPPWTPASFASLIMFGRAGLSEEDLREVAVEISSDNIIDVWKYAFHDVVDIETSSSTIVQHKILGTAYGHVLKYRRGLPRGYARLLLLGAEIAHCWSDGEPHGPGCADHRCLLAQVMLS